MVDFIRTSEIDDSADDHILTGHLFDDTRVQVAATVYQATTNDTTFSSTDTTDVA